MGKQADARQTLTAMHSHLFACVSEQAAKIVSDGYSTDGGLLRAKARYDEMSAEYQAVGAAMKAIDDNARIAAERDQLRADLAEERARRKALDRNWDSLQQGERDALTTAAGLRRALEGAPDYIDDPMTGDAASMLRRYVNTALAASPDDHARRLKAEALRATAKEMENLRDHIQEYIGPDDARDDIRRICWNRAKDLRDEADRLEKEAVNG